MTTRGARIGGARWLCGSLLLHALLIAVALHGVRGAHEAAPHPVEPPPGREAEVEVLEQPPASPLSPPVVAAAPSDLPRPQSAETAARAVVVAASPQQDATAAAAAESASRGEAEAVAVAPPAPSAAGPHLSLSQLGVDGANPFIQPMDEASLQAARAKRVQQRLDRALAQGTLSQDSAAGRGSASPVLRAIETAVYASTVPLNAQATFSFVIDGSGKLLSSSLGEASGDRAAWLSVAHATARALAGRTLRVPKGKGVKLTVAVTTRLELPSGADPGLEVDLLGVPLKKGAGSRSTRLDLLNPLNPLAPLSLAGDPADIGARPRRMVHAHVLKEELL